MHKRPRSILIAENNRAMAQALRLHLERAGYSVFVAHDGDQAAILAARQRFDLIIASLELPAISGAEFCRHVREDLRLTETPMAVCCSPNSKSNADTLVFNFGISRIFVKPIDPSMIVSFANETVASLVAAV
jgi:DNA-binding response OmpR family regulator